MTTKLTLRNFKSVGEQVFARMQGTTGGAPTGAGK